MRSCVAFLLMLIDVLVIYARLRMCMMIGCLVLSISLVVAAWVPLRLFRGDIYWMSSLLVKLLLNEALILQASVLLLWNIG